MALAKYSFRSKARSCRRRREQQQNKSSPIILNSDTVEPEVKPNVGKTPPKIKQIKEKGKEKEKTRVRTIIVK